MVLNTYGRLFHKTQLELLKVLLVNKAPIIRIA